MASWDAEISSARQSVSELADLARKLSARSCGRPRAADAEQGSEKMCECSRSCSMHDLLQRVAKLEMQLASKLVPASESTDLVDLQNDPITKLESPARVSKTSDPYDSMCHSTVAPSPEAPTTLWTASPSSQVSTPETLSRVAAFLAQAARPTGLPDAKEKTEALPFRMPETEHAAKKEEDVASRTPRKADIPESASANSTITETHTVPEVLSLHACLSRYGLPVVTGARSSCQEEGMNEDTQERHCPTDEAGQLSNFELRHDQLPCVEAVQRSKQSAAKVQALVMTMKECPSFPLMPKLCLGQVQRGTSSALSSLGRCPPPPPRCPSPQQAESTLSSSSYNNRTPHTCGMKDRPCLPLMPKLCLGQVQRGTSSALSSLGRCPPPPPRCPSPQQAESTLSSSSYNNRTPHTCGMKDRPCLPLMPKLCLAQVQRGTSSTLSSLGRCPPPPRCPSVQQTESSLSSSSSDNCTPRTCSSIGSSSDSCDFSPASSSCSHRSRSPSSAPTPPWRERRKPRRSDRCVSGSGLQVQLQQLWDATACFPNCRAGQPDREQRITSMPCSVSRLREAARANSSPRPSESQLRWTTAGMLPPKEPLPCEALVKPSALYHRSVSDLPRASSAPSLVVPDGSRSGISRSPFVLRRHEGQLVPPPPPPLQLPPARSAQHSARTRTAWVPCARTAPSRGSQRCSAPQLR
eukprot:TRINITY_DN9908_c0_g1_i2.p1 TRINITY_DN9908_c0_g1~~TRINITY_DN9908_c0_g1_i2.p1  ORF type:complete len:728 (-),score=101.07 TRINITY_DN9908_c0_g1_i2:276-2357(-)